jgi:hypothetical protein
MCNNINYQILSVQEQELWSLMEVKNYLRVSHENDNKLISNLIRASIVYAEQFLGVNFFISKITCLIEQAPSYLRLKHKPIVINKVFHIIDEEDKKDITKEFGYMDSYSQKISIAQEYWQRKLEINYEAGLGDKIPKPVLQGILMHIGYMYDFGENSVNILSEIKEIYLPYRFFKI